jgi:hypothetical protein
MCDFSLEAIRSRPAKVGDKLTTHTFKAGTRGFCAPEDQGMAVLPPGAVTVLGAASQTLRVPNVGKGGPTESFNHPCLDARLNAIPTTDRTIAMVASHPSQYSHLPLATRP